METLIDFFDRYVRGAANALIHDDGFGRWSYSNNQVRLAAEAFARRLDEAGLDVGARVLLWSENRPEWIVAFWGCLLRGVTVVPIDLRASADLLQRIAAATDPRGIIVGEHVAVDEVPHAGRVWRLHDIEWPTDDEVLQAEPDVRQRDGARAARAAVIPETVAEIVFTSGTTGAPKGVVITHRNILANITPIEREASQYVRYLWPLRPIRFLSLLPLSHMFGQALTLFLPPLVGAASVFTYGYNPDEIMANARRYRITLIVTVPRVLQILRDRLCHLAPDCASPRHVDRSLIVRWWTYRRAHRVFGWRCCGFVLGGADLDAGLEHYWRRLGFAVIQGYGLTETAPIVAWNHPLKAKPGTVGRPLEGVEIRLAPDGEILVRGPTVTSGYLTAPDEMRSAFEDGWFHTGDLGAFDDTGHLVVRGRKKDVIVTSEGTKVHPEDVERILEQVAGVREAAIVGHRVGTTEQVHAVLVLDPHADASAIVREANARVESHQRIQGVSVWPAAALPRTAATGKLKRQQIRQWIAEGCEQPGANVPALADDVDRLLARRSDRQTVTSEMTLDELGLTSLDRVELTMALEQQSGIRVSEAAVRDVRTVGDLRRLVEPTMAERTTEARRLAVGESDRDTFPRWTRSVVASLVRTVSQTTWLLPLVRIFAMLHVEGREHIRTLEGPVVFAANHQSHLDTPVILLALPGARRRAVAVAMAKEFFAPHFHPDRHGAGERLINSTLYYLAALFFNAFPLPREEPGTRSTLRYIGELASDGWSILLFPEGHRTERGEIHPFEAGVGLMASRLRLPVVPVRLEGVERVLHHSWRWPRRGPVRVMFGAPLRLDGEDYAALAATVHDAVTSLSWSGTGREVSGTVATR